jgi:hypothetical protein
MLWLKEGLNNGYELQALALLREIIMKAMHLHSLLLPAELTFIV